MSLNRVFLIGRPVADPERRAFGELSVAAYKLAVDRGFAKPGQSSADFLHCVSFGKVADFVNTYVKKGVKVLVEGSLRTSDYVNKEGRKIYKTEVIVEKIEFVESKRKQEETPAPTEPSGWENVSADEVPFF